MNAKPRRKSSASIRMYLAGMVVLVAVPFAALVVLLLLQIEERERAAFAQRVAGDAYAIASGVGRQLQDMATSLRVIATAPELEEGDLEEFHSRVQAALRSSDFHIIAVADDGHQLFNTRVPFGTELGKTSNVPHLKEVLTAGMPSVSDVFFGQTSKRWVFNVTIPLSKELPSRAAALIMTQDASALVGRLSTESLLPDWSVALVDQSGNVVANSDPSRAQSGEAFPAGAMAGLERSRGVIEGWQGAPDGLLAYARVPGWSWTVAMWGPVAGGSPIGETWRWLLFGGLAVLAVAVLAAVALGNRIRRSIVDIADMAQRLGRGEIVAPIDTPVIEANMVAGALSEASFDRSQAEERMHLVQRELVHRTKNLLAVVQSIINQTLRQSQSSEDFRVAASHRLEGLARSIDLLTMGEWAGVPMRRMVETHLATFADEPGRTEIRGEEFQLKPDAVQNLGLALHELATNAIKYGALSVPGGKVIVEWQEKPGDGGQKMLEFSWKETGGPPVDEPTHEGFGTTVLKRLVVASCRGSAEMEYAADGLRWTMTAPKEALGQEDCQPGGH